MREFDFMPIGESHGDAICVRYGDDASGYTINVIDGGYREVGEKIVDHVGKMYGSTRIDNILLTHADDDHARGLIPIVETLDVGALYFNRPWLYAAEFIHRHHKNFTLDGFIKRLKDNHQYLVELEEIAARKEIPVFPALQGTQFGSFTILAPSRDRYLDLLPGLSKTPDIYSEPVNPLPTPVFERVRDRVMNVLENWVTETLPNNPNMTTASNETSTVLLFSYNGFNALFTGDVGPQGLADAHAFAVTAGLPTALNFFQIPHQGSRRNVTPDVLDAWLGPPLQVLGQIRGESYCTVGESKSDHPRRVVANAITRRGYNVRVGRVNNISYVADVKRPNYNPIPAEQFWAEVEDYS